MATVTKGRTFVSGETVTPAKLNELVDNATVTTIQTADISDAAVTNAKIASGVDASKLTTGTLPADRIGSDAITTARINNAAVTPAKLSQPFTLATAQNSTSGTSIDFTGIPSWAKRITVILHTVSHNGTSDILVQLGSGSLVTSNYSSSWAVVSGSPSATTNGSSTAGFIVRAGSAGASLTGTMTIINSVGAFWISNHTMQGGLAAMRIGGGEVMLSGALDRLRLTTTNGTDTFDAGSVNIIYEG